MFRNQYDTDNTTWSPEGRLYQSEYACEAVKQGTCAVGARSKTHAVICGLRRTVGSMATHNDKIFRVNDFCGLAFSGITSDAKLLVNALRLDSMAAEVQFGTECPSITEMVEKVAVRSQKLTQAYGKRPFGVGLLIASYDVRRKAPVLIETSPTGDWYEYGAQAFGSRCHAANTYMDTHLEDLEGSNEEELIKHVILALARSLPSDQELTNENVHCAIVSAEGFFFVEGQKLDAAIAQVPPKPVEVQVVGDEEE